MIKETPIPVHCPILHRSETIYIRTVQWEDVFLAEFNGCDHISGAPECEECRKAAQKLFEASHQAPPSILWRNP